ncbi:clostripain-related cysteine peptidase [Reichenbachiella sp.]
MPTEKEWAIIFLVQIRNQTDLNYFIPLLEDLKNTTLRDEIEIILCLNFKSTFRSSFIPPDSEVSSHSSSQQHVTTGIFQLKTSAGEVNKNELVLLDELVHFDITSSYDIGKLFIRESGIRDRAKRHMLFTWDHGNGYSIFKKNNNESNSRLTLQKLNRAIEIGFQGKKSIDLMVMMNCWMQLIDTSFALKNNVEYLVAPQDHIKLDTYNARIIIEKIVQLPTIDSKQLSSIIVNSIKSKENSKIRTVSISAFKLTGMDTLFDLLDTLAIAVKKELEIDDNDQGLNKDKFLELRYQFGLTHVLDTGNKFIDFLSLIRNLIVVLRPVEIRICEEIIDLYTKLSIEFYTNHLNNNRNEWDRPYGMNICSPFTILPHEKSRDGFELEKVENLKDTAFSQTAWGRLMKSLRMFDFYHISGQL